MSFLCIKTIQNIIFLTVYLTGSQLVDPYFQVILPNSIVLKLNDTFIITIPCMHDYRASAHNKMQHLVHYAALVMELF